jgi:hypothetical protein
MTWKPGMGSPIGADEIAEAAAWNANAPPFDEQLRAIAAGETEATDSEREIARELLAAMRRMSDLANPDAVLR